MTTLARSAITTNIAVSKAVVRMVPPGSANTAGYMNIRSTGIADTLVRASAPKSVAMMTELHRSMMVGGQMTMVQQKSIAIPRNGTRVLTMGSFHLMIKGIKGNLTAGKRIPITLTFKKAGTVMVSAPSWRCDVNRRLVAMGRCGPDVPATLRIEVQDA
ncbi:MAG: copper chaperone PCu(A)C [Actinomycetota bacterium]|nr:copper chaperone PCu(A)C [Actinomycetota bacterium]